ncbi:MAG TPA: zf-TFIIB domain-containing protein [Planctomycetota bacterium]|nr:zf-TFIIB domain-containing protein [Planctomycetota bacterium]
MRILAQCSHCLAQYDVTGKNPGESIHCRCGALVLVAQPRVQDARVVRCASCGASRDSSGEVCAFCGSRFSAADKGWGLMCPACYCRLPNDANFCVECGLKINPQPIDIAPSTLKCPRCACLLTPRSVNPITLYECPACAGTWLGVDAFEAICKQREAQAIATQGLASHRARLKFELTESDKVKYVPCPVCKNLMNRHNFANISGVIIDTCKPHGVWLDNQELGQIVKFIESGGLEKSRAREAEEAAHNERMRKLNVPGAMMPGMMSPSLMTSRPSTALDAAFDVAGLIAHIFIDSH